MKGKILFATLLILVSGLANVGNTCLDDKTIMVNETYNGLETNSTYVCEYGCDTALNRCWTADTDFGILTLIVLIFFVSAMFYLANYFRPKHEQEEGGQLDIGAVGISIFWLFVGLFGILGILLFVTGEGSPLVSTSISSSVSWLRTFTDIYGAILGAFFVLVIVLYVKSLLGYFEQGED